MKGHVVISQSRFDARPQRLVVLAVPKNVDTKSVAGAFDNVSDVHEAKDGVSQQIGGSWHAITIEEIAKPDSIPRHRQSMHISAPHELIHAQKLDSSLRGSFAADLVRHANKGKTPSGHRSSGSKAAPKTKAHRVVKGR